MFGHVVKNYLSGRQANKLSEGSREAKGLKLGCHIASALFKIYIIEAMAMWKHKCRNTGYKYEIFLIYTTVYW
jgi:hypothetical protein